MWIKQAFATRRTDPRLRRNHGFATTPMPPGSTSTPKTAVMCRFRQDYYAYGRSMARTTRSRLTALPSLFLSALPSSLTTFTSFLHTGAGSRPRNYINRHPHFGELQRPMSRPHGRRQSSRRIRSPANIRWRISQTVDWRGLTDPQTGWRMTHDEPLAAGLLLASRLAAMRCMLLFFWPLWWCWGVGLGLAWLRGQPDRRADERVRNPCRAPTRTWIHQVGRQHPQEPSKPRRPLFFVGFRLRGRYTLRIKWKPRAGSQASD